MKKNRPKYAKIYLNSEEKEVRSGTATFCYGRVKHIKNKPYTTDGHQLKIFSIIPLKNKPDRIDYFLENRDVMFLDKNKVVYKRELVRLDDES